VPVRILVVEDDKHIRRILESLLTGEPSLKARAPEVVVAADGTEGLKALDKGPYDLVITDLLMPHMDGFQFCRELRRHQYGAHVPVIVTSAIYKDAGAQLRLRQEVGEHQFFAKPYEIRDLVKAVNRILDGGQLPPRKEPAAPAETPESGTIADRPPPRLLLDLAERKATGTLVLLRGKVKKEIGLQSGVLTSCDSNLRTETLGHFLVSRGVIDEKQHQEALAGAQTKRELLGQVLIELGWISEKDLLHQLAAQMRAKVASTLRWRDGDWSFVPGVPPPGLQTPIEAPLLVFLGLQKTAHVDEIAQLLAATRGRLSLTPRAERYRDTFVRVFGLTAIDALARTPQLEDLMAGTDPAAMLAQLDALLVCGLATLTPVAGQQQPGAATDPVALERISQPPPPAHEPENNLYDALFGDEPSEVRQIPLAEAPPDAEALRKEILSEYLALRHRNYYEILAVAPDSSTQGLTDAYAELCYRFRLERFAGADLGPDYAHLETLHQAFQRAFETLTTRRAEYDLGLGPVDPRIPLDAELLAAEAENLLAAGEVGQARAKLAQAAEAAPDVAHHHAWLGWATFLVGAEANPRAAASAAWPHLQLALAIDADDREAHELAGRVLFAAGDDERATLHLERALDAQPDREEALAALEALYARQGGWKPLERRYRKLIHRLGDGPLRTELWRRLGDLYLLRLGDRDSAMTAWEARFRAQVTASEWDAAFVAAAVTQSRSAQAAEFYRRYRPRFLQRSAPLDAARLPRHPDDDVQLGQLLSRTLAAQPPAFSLSHLGVTDDDRIDLLPSPFRRALGHTCALLGIPEPPIYRRGDLGVEISAGAVDPPILLAGPQALANPDLQQLAFRFGRSLGFLPSGRAVALTLPARPLAQLLKVDPTRFVRGLHRTADRLGLLACHDPGVALSLAHAPDELAAWALGEAHLGLREALGISVAV
jgi:CheY-like chemotaxis protein/tetratricopeptide (TPR) repeat protein